MVRPTHLEQRLRKRRGVLSKDAQKDIILYVRELLWGEGAVSPQEVWKDIPKADRGKFISTMAGIATRQMKEPEPEQKVVFSEVGMIPKSPAPSPKTSDVLHETTAVSPPKRMPHRIGLASDRFPKPPVPPAEVTDARGYVFTVPTYEEYLVEKNQTDYHALVRKYGGVNNA